MFNKNCSVIQSVGTLLLFPHCWQIHVDITKDERFLVAQIISVKIWAGHLIAVCALGRPFCSPLLVPYCLKVMGFQSKACPEALGSQAMRQCHLCICRIPALVMAVCSHTYKVTMVDRLVGFSPGNHSWALYDDASAVLPCAPLPW